MTLRDERFIKSACERLEARFQGVTASSAGFDAPYLGGVRDGFIFVEVLNVPPGNYDEVLGFAESLTTQHLRAGGSFVTFRLWASDEMTEDLRREAEQIVAGRVARYLAGLPMPPSYEAMSWNTFLDAGGSGENGPADIRRAEGYGLQQQFAKAA